MGILDFSKKINAMEIIPMMEIERINDVIMLEIKISSFSDMDLKLMDNKNINKIENNMKLIINWFTAYFIKILYKYN